MKKLSLLLLLLSVVAQKPFAQNNATVVAFTKSLEKEKNQDYLAAIKALTDLHDSTSYEVVLRLGWLNYKAGYKKKSIKYYQKAIDAQPKAIEPRIGIGFPTYELENFADLIEQDKKILEIDPNNKTTNSNLGLIYYYDKKYKQALPHFQRVVDLYPFDYNNNLMLGLTCVRLGKNVEAEKYLHVTLLFSPGDVAAKEGLEAIGKTVSEDDKVTNAFAQSYELANKPDYKGAINVLKEIYDKDSYFINLRLGWLYHLSGSEIEAGTYYKIASTILPNAIEPKLGFVIPAEVTGNKNDQKNEYESILTLDPQNTLAHYKLGLLHYGKKEFQLAFDHFEKVVTLYPFDFDGVLMFAWANYQTGKTQESHQWFYRTLCLVPDNVSAKQGLSLKPVEEQNQLDHKEIIKPK